MRLHCLQHISFECPGTIAEWAKTMGHAVSYTYFYEPAYVLPPAEDFDALVIMGGSMNVDEENLYPWLREEKQFIKNTLDGGKKILAVCLGAQLVASVLGCKIYRATEKEIGFFPVSFSEGARQSGLFNHFSDPYTVFHWHGDTFDLPGNAVLAASGDTCRHQAYLINERVLGLQFHLELTAAIIDDMILHDGSELQEKGRFIQTIPGIHQGYAFLKQNREDMFALLNRFFHPE